VTTATGGRAALACGALLLGLGVLSLVEAFRLRDDWQGARLMPAVLGVVFVLLAAGHLRTSSVVPAGPDAFGRRRVVLLLAVLALYAGAMPYVGFLPTTVLFVLLLVRALGDYGWPKTLALTVVIALACHVVFKEWLGMPLP
jgi:putative tricarboxylic transport membrane protein